MEMECTLYIMQMNLRVLLEMNGIFSILILVHIKQWIIKVLQEMEMCG